MPQSIQIVHSQKSIEYTPFEKIGAITFLEAMDLDPYLVSGMQSI